jgi:ribosomal protein L40E
MTCRRCGSSKVVYAGSYQYVLPQQSVRREIWKCLKCNELQPKEAK